MSWKNKNNVPGVLFSLSEQEVKQCKEFAKNVVKTDVYGFRNGQTDIDRRREQHCGSKYAEIAAFLYLKSLGLEPTYPDFSIKPRHQKSWAPDLTLEDLAIHVKSQDTKSAVKYGISWIGEKTDKELFEKASGYVILCLVSLENNSVRILGSPSAKFLKENNYFSEPKIKRYREKKFAIYYDDIEKDKKLWEIEK